MSRVEVMGPVNDLDGSSDADNAAFGNRRVIAAEIDSRAIYEGASREPLVDAGTAMLDRLRDRREPHRSARRGR